jgi:hypothetical protein
MISRASSILISTRFSSFLFLIKEFSNVCFCEDRGDRALEFPLFSVFFILDHSVWLQLCILYNTQKVWIHHKEQMKFLFQIAIPKVISLSCIPYI